MFQTNARLKMTEGLQVGKLHRNAVAFQALRPCLPLLIKNCRDDAVLWKARLPRARLADGDAWLALLDSARH
jgi:hypothetical protein